ncbi:MAG: polysaccharide biosynthesis/export family protein [Pirellulaceae bacterium]|jgi:polysaccharide export outer membrane protein|nr:polysaccharide biosynthesis/export family protein [Pirellulaceae bacterium]
MKQPRTGIRRDKLQLAGLLTAISLAALSCGCQASGSYNAASLPAALAAPPVQSSRQLNLSHLSSANFRSDVIQPGDLVEVTISTGLADDDGVGKPVRVNDYGSAEVPLVGQIQLAGLQLTQAEEAIGRESVTRGIYRTPSVAVGLKQRKTNHVTVMGAVKQPGDTYLPAANSNLLSALSAAGGLSKEAGTIVDIRHPTYFDGRVMAPPRSQRIDLAVATRQGGDFRLLDGASVTVIEKPLQAIHVIGLVHRPDQFEMPENQELRLLGAIALAGGRRLQLADKVKVIRTLPGNRAPVTINASVRSAKSDPAANMRLAAGDVVSVEETPTTFTIETLRSFIRFGFSSAIPGF